MAYFSLQNSPFHRMEWAISHAEMAHIRKPSANFIFPQEEKYHSKLFGKKKFDYFCQRVGQRGVK